MKPPRRWRRTARDAEADRPDFDVLAAAVVEAWDEPTRDVVLGRLKRAPAGLRFFQPEEAPTVGALSDLILAQEAEPRVPVVELLDARYAGGRLDGYRYAGMPDDRGAWRQLLKGLDHTARARHGRHRFQELDLSARQAIVRDFQAGVLEGGPWNRLDSGRAWWLALRAIVAEFYAHPLAWSEIGFPGPACPHGSGAAGAAAIRRLGRRTARPEENDSAWLLDPVRRGVPQAAAMRRFRDRDEVDMCIVGAGAGGSVLAQRLARRGWRVVVLEAGPFWDPDRDWVADEAGSHGLYWTSTRITGGSDPIELGKNSSGRGAGGSMVPSSGYLPRLHPSDFRARALDGVGEDWPLGYWDLEPHYRQCERESPVAGQDWPWGHPHSYLHSPRAMSRGAQAVWRGALASGIEMRAGPVGIADRGFGNRARGACRAFCSLGCKANARASPLVTHLPDALAHGVEVRSESLAARIPLGADGRAIGVEYVDAKGAQHLQQARLVALAGGALETPRLLLNSAQKGFPAGLCNNEDQVGRYLMVQGAPQVAGRLPFAVHMHQAPPAELCSEQFYETDEHRGFVRGFSLRTVSLLPIGWAEQVTAEGHWGTGLRRYMRDYGYWAVLGTLNELLPLAENRVTVAGEVADEHGLPVARLDYGLCDNDRSNVAHSIRVMREIWGEAGADDILTGRRSAHPVGGCRMGTAPGSSVCSSDHRTWAVPNLFVADSAVFPTQGSASPALTVMALASRLAERLAAGAVR